MNEWSIKTLDLVEKTDYLDNLQNIYPNEDGNRSINKKIIESIKDSYNERDDITLINKLLDLDKFPYKDSYVGFLRIDRSAIKRNPQTVKRICNRLYDMGLEQVINGMLQPKEANARRGNQFRDWIKRNFTMLDLHDFRNSVHDIVVLNANEADATNFCRTDLGMGISKRPDLVAKSGKHYVVGEAKFLSSTGGNQGRAFDDGINLATNVTGRAYKIFILDSVHWIVKGSEEYNRIEHSNAAIFSVLLLNDYFKSLIK